LKVFLSRKAAKVLDEAPPELRRRLDEKISELSLTPFPAGCRKLRGAQDSYRIRVGDIRVLYTILAKDEILVFKIARRESAYN